MRMLKAASIILVVTSLILLAGCGARMPADKEIIEIAKEFVTQSNFPMVNKIEIQETEILAKAAVKNEHSSQKLAEAKVRVRWTCLSTQLESSIRKLDDPYHPGNVVENVVDLMMAYDNLDKKWNKYAGSEFVEVKLIKSEITDQKDNIESTAAHQPTENGITGNEGEVPGDDEIKKAATKFAKQYHFDPSPNNIQVKDIEVIAKAPTEIAYVSGKYAEAKVRVRWTTVSSTLESANRDPNNLYHPGNVWRDTYRLRFTYDNLDKKWVFCQEGHTVEEGIK
jgi:hypothetical protein